VLPAPNPDPDANGLTLTFNQRFPGQTAFAESGLNYNYFRDDDPQTGRYVESDPIGLHGGANTYLYVFAGPLSNVDQFGLETQPGSGKPSSYPNCFKWPSFPKKGCDDCALQCQKGQLKATRDCIKDCRWRYVLAPGQSLLLGACSEMSQEWGRQCLDGCQ